MSIGIGSKYIKGSTKRITLNHINSITGAQASQLLKALQGSDVQYLNWSDPIAIENWVASVLNFGYSFDKNGNKINKNGKPIVTDPVTPIVNPNPVIPVIVPPATTQKLSAKAQVISNDLSKMTTIGTANNDALFTQRNINLQSKTWGVSVFSSLSNAGALLESSRDAVISTVASLYEGDGRYINNEFSFIEGSSATAANIMTKLNYIYANVKAGDNVYFDINAHGGKNYVWSMYGKEQLDSRQVIDKLQAIKNKIGSSGTVSLFVNTCYSGVTVDYAKSINAGVNVITSSSNKQPTMPFAFTSSLAKAVEGSLYSKDKNTTDKNNDGYLTFQEVYDAERAILYPIYQGKMDSQAWLPDANKIMFNAKVGAYGKVMSEKNIQSYNAGAGNDDIWGTVSDEYFDSGTGQDRYYQSTGRDYVKLDKNDTYYTQSYQDLTNTYFGWKSTKDQTVSDTYSDKTVSNVIALSDQAYSTNQTVLVNSDKQDNLPAFVIAGTTYLLNIEKFKKIENAGINGYATYYWNQDMNDSMQLSNLHLFSTANAQYLLKYGALTKK